MKVLITGGQGMLGRALQESFSSRHQVLALGKEKLDVTDLAAARRVVTEFEPSWILHAAAFTHVDAAESETLEAYRVNALGSRNLAAVALDRGASIAYFSTDYVFDGRGDRPYREWDSTNPINHYGKSKLAGEDFVRRLCPRHLVVRTSWLFGPGGANFIGKILSLAKQRGSLNVVNDQRGSPTYTADLAETTMQLVESGARGIYHCTNGEHCSWHELAREVLRQADLRTPVHPTTSSEFRSAAPRPAFSALDNFCLKLEGRRPLRPWPEAVAAYLAELHV